MRRIDAVGTDAEPADDDPEECEDRKTDEKPVREAEEDAGGSDREDGSVRLQERDPESSIGELLDRRRNEGHHDEERDECSGTARIPSVRHQSLLLRRIEVAEQREDALVHERRGIDRAECQDGESDSSPPASGPAESEDVSLRQAPSDEQQDPEHDAVLDECRERRRVAVRQVVRRLRVAEASAVRQKRECDDEDEPSDQAPRMALSLRSAPSRDSSTRGAEASEERRTRRPNETRTVASISP